MKELQEPPDGIIVTISRGMYKDQGGYRRWISNFLYSMESPEFQDGTYAYHLRASSRPTQDKILSYVYLCIGNRIRYRGLYAGVKETPDGQITFDSGRTIHGRFWILVNGPIERAPFKIPRQGFQGFRYTTKLW